jgi:hypothetical protein
VSDLVTRLKQAAIRAHQKVKRTSGSEQMDAILDAKKLSMCVEQVETVEKTLAEIDSRI